MLRGSPGSPNGALSQLAPAGLGGSIACAAWRPDGGQLALGSAVKVVVCGGYGDDVVFSVAVTSQEVQDESQQLKASESYGQEVWWYFGGTACQSGLGSLLEAAAMLDGCSLLMACSRLPAPLLVLGGRGVRFSVE